MLCFRSESNHLNLNERVEEKSKDHICHAGLGKNANDNSGDEDWYECDLKSHITLEDRGQSEQNDSYKLESFVAVKRILEENCVSVWVRHILGTNKGDD